MRAVPIVITFLPLAACSGGSDEVRGVDRNETLLSVSATGEADAVPDEARFQAGIEVRSSSARAASETMQERITEVIAALREVGIAPDDIQTAALNIQRVDYGPERGQYRAVNTVTVTVRDVAKAGEAVSAVSEAGANVMSGPDLRMSDPEASANSAYANAFRAARARADAYAEAADMEVSRVLYIRDAGGVQGGRYFSGAQAIALERAEQTAAPPPVSPPPPPPAPPAFMPGRTTSSVTVQVDFALKPQ